ncbi:MAG: S-layer homology domain-containing protein [Eubacteriales bacterium]|nr:S-layer homology domain-containing protein [Eubacteriales bacterium]
MRKLNKKLALFLSLVIIILTVGGISTVSASGTIDAKAYYNAEINGLTIEGTITTEADNVTISVYRPGFAINDGKAIKDAISTYTNEKVSLGAFSYSYTASSSDTTSDDYTVYINYGGESLKEIKAFYATPAQANTALARINAIDEATEGYFDAFNAELKYFGKLPAMYQQLSLAQQKAVIATVLEKSDYQSFKAITDRIEELAMDTFLYNPSDAQTFRTVIEKYNDIVQCDLENPLYKKYVKGNTGKENNVFAYVVSKAPYNKIEDIKDEFQKGVIIQALNSVTVIGEIYNNTLTNLSILSDKSSLALLKGLDLITFKNFTEARQEAMLKYFLKNDMHKVSSCEAFVLNWNNAVKIAPTLPLPTNEGPGGGGGGGSPISNDPTEITTGKGEITGIAPGKTPVDDSSVAPMFKDLSSVAWAEESIVALAKAGIVNGKEANNFAPNDNITREEFLKMLYLCANLSIIEDAQTTFIDVNKGDWYYDIVASAQQQGLINGVSNVHYGVGQNITRQDMSVMIVRLISSLGVELSLSADDAKFIDDTTIAPYANVSVYTMKKAGIINGYENGSFRPNANATRAEAAKIIYALCSLLVD